MCLTQSQKLVLEGGIAQVHIKRPPFYCPTNVGVIQIHVRWPSNQFPLNVTFTHSNILCVTGAWTKNSNRDGPDSYNYQLFH